MNGRRLPPELEAIVRAVVESSRLDAPRRAEVEAELRAHFEDGLEAGLTAHQMASRFGDPDLAGRRIARARRTGARSTHTDEGRWWMSMMEWGTELKRSIRRLARSPGFAAVVVTTLALGIGANTAIFTVVNAVLLEPLPYAEPDRLVRVYEVPEGEPTEFNYLRAPAVVAFRSWDQVFDGFGALYTYTETGADLMTGSVPERVTVVPAAAGYFETLGVPPAMGRTFREEESLAPGDPSDDSAFGAPLARVAVLSHGLWMRRFGGQRDVLGRTIDLDGVGYQVVGVMPPEFVDPFGARADLWTPQDLRTGTANSRNGWGNFFLSGVARLRPGLTLAAAQERVDALFDRLVEANPEAEGRWRPRLVPLRDDLVGSTRATMLWIMAGAAGLVLLTACVNLANLLFARGLGRDRDVALRAALGSGRGRIVGGLLLETGVLAVVGGAVGVALGWAGVRALLALSPDALPMVAEPRLSPGVLAFAFVATLVALVVAGLAPALRISTTPPAEVLRSEGRSASGGRRIRRLRDLLAVVQVAAALVLVAGAALLGRSFAELRSVPLGMDPQGVLAFEVHLPGARYPDGAAREAFHRTLGDRIAELSEVQAAGAVSWLPLSGRYHVWGVYWDPELDPRNPDLSDEDRWQGSDMRIFSGDYFGALDIPLIRGVAPGDLDLEGERVAWVNQRLVEDVFGDVDPVGQQVFAAGDIRRVAGVVADVPFDAEGGRSPTTYIPHAHHADDRNWALTQTVRTRGDLAVVRDRIRTIVADIDPQLVLHRPRSLADVVATARAQDRFATVLMGAFAFLALALSLVGTYGVLAGAVAGRTREFGIRMALGADAGTVRQMVLRYAAALVLPGVALGLLGAWIGSRFLRGLLFQVQPRDPWVYLGAAAVFVAVGLLAGWVPVRRATRVDPARTLTAE